MSNSNVKPIPDRNHTMTPSLIIKNAAKAIDFYKEVFNAKELYKLEHDNQIMHAEMLIGNSLLMLADEMPGMDVASAETIGDTLSPTAQAEPQLKSCSAPIILYIYVDNVDAIFNKAIESGAKVLHPLQDQFYGDRIGAIIDPFGFKWTIATHIENVPNDEIERRSKKFMEKLAQKGSGDDNYKQKYLKYKQKYQQLKNE